MILLGFIALGVVSSGISAQENRSISINKTVVSSTDVSEEKYNNAGLAATPIMPVFPSEERG